MTAIHKVQVLLAALVLWLAFLVATIHLDRDSLWADEGWSLWAVRSADPVETLHHVAEDVHPPLYLIVLDGWVAVAGRSVYAVRLLSTLFVLIALAATVAVGNMLFDGWTGLSAALLLGTSGFAVYYAREARMYTMLMALAALATWFYLRWTRCPTRAHTLIYAVLLAALLYTHYDGGWIILTHGLHALIVRPRRAGRWLGLAGLAALLYVPWIPVGLHQLHEHPDGPFALSIPTNRATVRALFEAVTSRNWLLMVAPFGLGVALPRLRRHADAIVLLVVWLLLTPVAVLAVNKLFIAFYQARYVIGILPAGALLVAYGLRHVRWRPLAAGWLLWLVVVQLDMHAVLWPPKPDWRHTMADMLDTRRPSEPMIALIDPKGVEAYYDRALNIRRGIVVDLFDRNYSPADARNLVAGLAREPSVWVVMPVNIALTWDVVAALDTTRHSAYRASLVNLVFYRFDLDGDRSGVDLRFQFGDQVTYAGVLGDQRTAGTGESVCVDVPLITQVPLDGQYSAGLHVVGADGRAVAGWDAGVGIRAAGESFTLTPCVTIPEDVPPGDYHLTLAIYRWATVERLLVIEDVGGDALYWGDTLVIGPLSVE